jgi:hypothetical protein
MGGNAGWRIAATEEETDMTTRPGSALRPARTVRALRASAALLVASTLACGDDGTGPPAAELTGSWEATAAEVTTTDGSAVTVDVLALGGAFALTLSGDGSFTVQVALPGEPGESWSGSWTALGDVLRLDFTSGLMGRCEFDMTLAGNELTLRGADTEFDVDGDGQEEPVQLDLVLRRI